MEPVCVYNLLRLIGTKVLSYPIKILLSEMEAIFTSWG